MSINWLELLLLSARNPRAGMSKLLESNFNNFQLLQIAMLAVCLISIFLSALNIDVVILLVAFG